MADACSGDVGRIEAKMTVALTVGNDHMHKEAMGEMLTAFMNGRKNIPDQIKACNAQRVRADENHPYLQTLKVE